MLVVLDSILNRITQNRAKGKQTFIFIDEIYLLFQHEYSANFLFTLWKRVRKYGAYYDFVNADTEDEFNAYIAKCKELAIYDTGVTAEYGDKLITLSTCEYSRNNGRMVVVAKKAVE